MSSPITWTRASWVVVLAGVAFVAVSAKADPPNTGMADPSALVSAFDHFAAGGAPANVVILSLSNLRGVSSEAVNAGGRVTVDLATGAVGSSVELLPPDGTFDLWLIDNQPDSGHTTLAEDGDALMKVGTYAVVSGEHRLSVTLGLDGLHQLLPRSGVRGQVGREPDRRVRADGFQHVLRSALSHRQIRFVDDAAAALGFDPTAAATREADSATRYRPGPPAVSARDVRGQRTDLRDLSRRDQQLHCRSGPHCHSASERSALRGRDQSGVGGAGESGPAATVRIDPRQRRRIRPVDEGSSSAALRTCKRSRTRRRPRTRALASTSAPTGEIPIHPSASAGATMAHRSATSRSSPSRSTPRRR